MVASPHMENQTLVKTMRIFIFLIMLDNTYVEHFETTDCALAFAIAGTQYPDHDLYCIEPGYKLRPQARK